MYEYWILATYIIDSYIQTFIHFHLSKPTMTDFGNDPHHLKFVTSKEVDNKLTNSQPKVVLHDDHEGYHECLRNT